MTPLTHNPNRNCVNSLGIPVDDLTLDAAVDRIERLARTRDGKARLVSTLNVDFLVDEGVIDEEDRELFWYAETAEEIWQGILQWYIANGTPLLRDSD